MCTQFGSGSRSAASATVRAISASPAPRLHCPIGTPRALAPQGDIRACFNEGSAANNLRGNGDNQRLHNKQDHHEAQPYTASNDRATPSGESSAIEYHTGTPRGPSALAEFRLTTVILP